MTTRSGIPPIIDPRRKFLLLLIVIYIVSVPIISSITYFILRDNAISDAYTTGKLYLTSVEATKHYVADELRPSLYRAIPGKFVLEGMSRSYVANSIARRIYSEYGGFKYKNAALSNPMNPLNLADDFEADVIRTFIRDRKIRDWQGFRTKDGEQYYVLARPGEPIDSACLYCHGDPSAAPAEVVTRYGKLAGFGRTVGELIDAKIVYIPIEVPLAAAKKSVGIFVGLYTIFFSAVFLIIHVRFTNLYNQVEGSRKKIEAINADLTELNEELETLIAERTMSVMALTVADKVRNPASVISWTCKRLIQKGRLPETLQDELKSVIEESEKLETIVRNFETLLKSKKSMFRYEDMNAIVSVVMSAIEKEALDKGVSVVVKLAEGPLKINTQRNLLRVAIFHVIRNAIEATPAGGEITVTTKADRETVSLGVSDTGPGIGQEDIEKIFDPFFSTKQFRFGMGLPIVKQVVSEHLGELRVESEPGKGTALTMVFPVRWMEKE